MEICNKDTCVGCFSCVTICPKQCIRMEEDAFGNIYPHINENDCIDCGQCIVHCPVHNQCDFFPIQETYAAWAKDAQERETSSSGGVAAILTSLFLRDGGIVYGSVINQTLEVVHERIIDSKHALKTKGSKYVHSYINDCYKLCRKDLQQEKKVLFFGTPCQIAGLHSYLKKKDDNLYTVDIICHGVPSHKMLKEELDDMRRNADIDNFTFRDDNRYRMRIMQDHTVIKCKDLGNPTYLSAFMRGLSCRENCYQCPYARPERVADLTLGDFWGLGELHNQVKEENKGISAVLVNTAKGNTLFTEISSELILEKRDAAEAVRGNAQLQRPTVAHPGREEFLKLYTLSDSFHNTVKKSLHMSIFYYIKLYLNKVYCKVKCYIYYS